MPNTANLNTNDPIDGSYRFDRASVSNPNIRTARANSRAKAKLSALMIAGATTAGVVGGSIAAKISDEQDKVPVSTQTTIVTAEPGDDIWGLTEQELKLSGIDPQNVADMRQYVDPNVALNEGAGIQAGQNVVLQDVPNQGPPITTPPNQG